MNKVPYLIAEHSLTVIIDGVPSVIDDTNPHYRELRKALCENPTQDNVEPLVNKAISVAKYLSSAIAEGEDIVVDGDSVTFNGVKIENSVCERILRFYREGLPCQPLINFLRNLLKNPSRRSVEQLYKFLEYQNLPITADGNFMAYKYVRDNYKDGYSGKFDNSVGNTISCPRNEVDDDPTRGCSYGFHVGALEYVAPVINNSGGSYRGVLVEVNPADVVAVPHDCSFQKVRTCKYTVVQDYKGALEAPLVRSYNGDAGGYDAYDTKYNPYSRVEDAEDDEYWDEHWDDDDYLDEDGWEDEDKAEAKSEAPKFKDGGDYCLDCRLPLLTNESGYCKQCR